MQVESKSLIGTRHDYKPDSTKRPILSKKSKKDSAENIIGVTVSDLTEAQKRAVPNASGVVINRHPQFDDNPCRTCSKKQMAALAATFRDSISGR